MWNAEKDRQPTFTLRMRHEWHFPLLGPPYVYGIPQNSSGNFTRMSTQRREVLDKRERGKIEGFGMEPERPHRELHPIGCLQQPRLAPYGYTFGTRSISYKYHPIMHQKIFAVSSRPCHS